MREQPAGDGVTDGGQGGLRRRPCMEKLVFPPRPGPPGKAQVLLLIRSSDRSTVEFRNSSVTRITPKRASTPHIAGGGRRAAPMAARLQA